MRRGQCLSLAMLAVLSLPLGAVAQSPGPTASSPAASPVPSSSPAASLAPAPVLRGDPAASVPLPAGWSVVPGASLLDARGPDDTMLAMSQVPAEDGTPVSDLVTSLASELEAGFGQPTVVTPLLGPARIEQLLDPATGPLTAWYVFPPCGDVSVRLQFSAPAGAAGPVPAEWDAIALATVPCAPVPLASASPSIAPQTLEELGAAYLAAVKPVNEALHRVDCTPDNARWSRLRKAWRAVGEALRDAVATIDALPWPEAFLPDVRRYVRNATDEYTYAFEIARSRSAAAGGAYAGGFLAANRAAGGAAQAIRQRLGLGIVPDVHKGCR